MQRIRFATLGVPSHLPHIHVTRLNSPGKTVPHLHDFYEAFLVVDGGGTHHLNDETIALAPGDLWVIRPADVHWFSAAETALVFVNIAVSAAWYHAMHAVFGWHDLMAKKRHAAISNEDVRRLTQEIHRPASMIDPVGPLRLWQEIRRCIGFIDDVTASQVAPAWLESLRRDLASMPESLAEPIAFWQERSGRSPEHLSRSCRRYYGTTFRDLINQARIERAKYLLRTTDHKVISIAFECGFGNLAYFHRCFAQQMAMTPKQWRDAGNVAVP